MDKDQNPEVFSHPAEAVPQKKETKPVEKAPKEPGAGERFAKQFNKIFQMMVTVGLVAALAYLCWGVWDGLNRSVHLQTRNNPQECQNDTCIAFDARYKDGLSVWEAQPGWPLKIMLSGTQFNENDRPVVIRCPVQLNGNEFTTKLIFLLKQENILQCSVTST
ncbi:MAG: hypothetical protein QY314_02600 [Candidatus Dojkabacteria bacterium]|nr:MAG: hypothetical protein QY314_02600 [Candidatus Dojkabacteria bacterium]